MNVRLRHMQTGDAEAVSRLSAQLGYRLGIRETEDRIRDVLSTKDHCAFVALDEEKIIGWVQAFVSHPLESPGFIEIGGLVVDERYRNKGVGKLLVGMIENWCIEKKVRTLRLRTNVKRREAHLFYEKNGFSCIKEQKVYQKQI